MEVKLQDPAAPPPPVHGDRESLERLATNLLDNAVKYNREGGRWRSAASGPGRGRGGEVER